VVAVGGRAGALCCLGHIDIDIDDLLLYDAPLPVVGGLAGVYSFFLH